MARPRYFKPKHRRALAEILLAAGLLAVCIVLSETAVLPAHRALRIPAFALPYLVVGWRVLRRAGRNITRGQVFDEHFLMSLATLGAFGVGEYAEAVFVMLFYRVGELFEELAVGRTRASIAALMEIRPDRAHVERNGTWVTVDPAEVSAGEIILIRPGERVPLDGVITEGVTTLDTAALTGEALPRRAAAGDDIISGCVNQTGLLRVRVSRVYRESTVARILALAESAAERKSNSEHFITRFARYYTPAVVAAALLLAVLPPLFLGVSDGGVWREWIGRALSFLVISCPCALVISVPLSFFAGIGGASRKGILIKGSGYLEALAQCDTVVLDKTGTLTEGRFAVRAVTPASGFAVDDLLCLAASVERESTHPIARALVAAYTMSPAEAEVREVTERAGYGITARVRVRNECHTVAVGHARLMAHEGIAYPASNVSADASAVAGTTVYIGVDGRYAGRITVSDAIRPEAAAALGALRRRGGRCRGTRRIVMLTGDGPSAAASVAGSLGVDAWHHSLLPADKVACMEAILADPAVRGRVAFVGDGVNDAPVLARADVGIAMGGMGSDAAIEAADVVLMKDSLSSLPDAMAIARKTLGIVRQNIVLALAVKLAALALSAVGLAPLWLAVFADVGVSVLAILNALRAMR